MSDDEHKLDAPSDEDAPLQPADLEGNPVLGEVLQVKPTEATAMIDLEAIEAERARRAAIEASQPKPDPEATNMISLDEVKRRHAEAQADDEPEEKKPGLFATAIGLSPLTKIGTKAGADDAPGTVVSGPPKAALAARRRARLILGGAAAVILLGAVGGAAALYFLVGPGAGALVTLTSVPPGATVFVDGKEVGTAPLQSRIRPGPHKLRVQLDQFAPYEDVVDVPVEGLPLLIELDESAKPRVDMPKADAPDLTADAGEALADAVNTDNTEKTDAGNGSSAEDADGGNSDAAEADAATTAADEIAALIEARAFDDAFRDLQAFLKTHPEDPRGETLLLALTDAREAARAAPSTASPTPSTDERDPPRVKSGTRPSRTGTGRRVVRRTPKNTRSTGKTAYASAPKNAREALREAKRALADGANREAKRLYLQAIRLDPRGPDAHRDIARLYLKEGRTSRTRYHLKRYLALGGSDGDRRVRDWLADHPE